MIQKTRINDPQIRRLDFQLLRRHRDQHFTRGGGSFPQLRRHRRRAETAERSQIKGSEIGITHDQMNRGYRHVQFIGNRLYQRGAGVLAEPRPCR